MKTKITLVAVVAIILNAAWISPAYTPIVTDSNVLTLHVPAEAGFSFFRIHRQGKNGVTATWGLTSEDGVSGFLVEKTYEDPTDPYAFWEMVSAMPSTGQRSYKCTDNGVFPGYITYRVSAEMNNGRSMISVMETIHINGH